MGSNASLPEAFLGRGLVDPGGRKIDLTAILIPRYRADSYDTFAPWVKHWDVYDFDESQKFEPYDKESALEYLAFCPQQVAERVGWLN